MREVRIDRFGGPEELYVADAPVPTPGPGEVLIRVRAAGTNPLDYKIRDGSSGMARSILPEDFPLVLGREASGVVEALGDGVTRFAVGQPVFGMAALSHPGRCYAEYAALPAADLAPAPADADLVALGGLGLVGNTAWLAVHEAGRVRPGDKVLVHGGAGGVGQLVVQLALAAGAEVWATASTQNQGRLADLGAHPIDYRTTDPRDVCPLVDVVIDGVYFDTFVRSLDLVAPGGRIVPIPSLADVTSAAARGIEAVKFMARPMPDALAALAEDLAAGRLSFEISAALPLERAADAHRALESGHARGKIVLDPTLP